MISDTTKVGLHLERPLFYFYFDSIKLHMIIEFLFKEKVKVILFKRN